MAFILLYALLHLSGSQQMVLCVSDGRWMMFLKAKVMDSLKFSIEHLLITPFFHIFQAWDPGSVSEFTWWQSSLLLSEGKTLRKEKAWWQGESRRTTGGRMDRSIEEKTMKIQCACSSQEPFCDEETELLTSLYLKLEC